MRRPLNILNPAMVVLLSFSAAAQARPDFSGRWTSEPESAPAPGDGRQAGSRRDGPAAGSQQAGVSSGDMGSGWGKTINLSQDDRRLRVEYEFFARGDMQPPLIFVYALDGAETKNSVMMGRGIQEQTSKTTWEADKLIITTTHVFDKMANGQPTTAEVRRTLWLESPTSLIVETTREGVPGGPVSTTRTVYRKL
jgi:hypothetical protein